MKKILLTFLMWVFVLCVWAQDRIVRGTVTDASTGENLPGVNVLLKGSNTGVNTDLDGNYQISVPSDGGTLIFSFIGMERREISVGARSVIDVEMVTDVQQLSEVVVTGQGSGIEKRRLSTTVDRISTEQLESTPIVQLDQVLRSQLPNAQIRLASGQPGTASFIRSRGPVSAAVGTTPIIYIDGVRVDNLNSQAELGLATGGAVSSAIADIPIENIESIEFVKGGAATTLFGADAANGVLQIFTKKGTAGKARVTFETQLGAQVGTEDYLFFEETADIIFRPGLQQSYRIGVDGGSNDVTYSFSGNLYGDDGFRYGNSQIRRNFRAGLKAKVNDVVTYTTSAGFSSNEFTRDYNANSSFGEFGNLETVARWGDLTEKTDEELEDIKEQVRNIIELTDITERVRRFQNSHQFDFNFTEAFSVRALMGLDFRSSEQKNITTNEQLIVRGSAPEGSTDRGTIDVAKRDFFTVTGEINAAYRKDFDNMSTVTIVGGQFFRNQDEQIQINASEVTEGSISINNAGETTAEDFLSAVTNYGFFAKENLGFKDRYFIEAGIRFDGNTAFGEDIGLVAFPSVGVSYMLSDEPFLRDNISIETLSSIKIRANYGVAGNFPRPFANDKLIAVNNYLGEPSYTFGNPGDPTLKPERTATTELGLDVGLFTNRVNFQFTYYNATTRDALFNAPFASSVGQINQLRNIGEINNEGIELGLNLILVDNADFTLTIGGSFNTVENIVVSSGGAPEFVVGGFTFLGSFVKEGEPLGYLRGNKPIYDEENNLVEVEPNAYLGNPIAPIFGSVNLSARYKNLSLYITSDYQSGGSTVAVDDVLRYFAGASTLVPEYADESAASFFDLTPFWVQESDFYKVRNISLMYSFADGFFNNTIKNLTIGANVLNPLNFYKADVDPEVSGSGFGTQNSFAGGGFGYGTESAPRVYLGTVRFSF
ncbi:TonB-dependent receptor [Marivirga sp. S37H4]|uniref:TonB-dependent receptor n=1 Tax=Marivirga aurantiaca TaxID=2802615 RepID=A0A935C4S5_9BACT|nr:TonB-dependent receptor [Marivirga aurantiaca]MBK6263456.1 TonB-dependent receptor [Marivirga aurantiaca]